MSVKEIWRPVPSNPKYFASSLGRIINSRKKLLTVFMDSSGYQIVSFWQPGGGRIRVHNIIAETFLGKKPYGSQVNHKNGNKCDNRPENLEYVSQADNLRHAFRTGLMKNSGRRRKET